jgi:hypothetical protein
LKILIVYHLRLGDIARCLPIAKYFADKGNKVWFECLPEYHGLFELVDYCTPLYPQNSRNDFDRVIDLQIWPDLHQEFCQSEKNWSDFVYDLLPEGKDINRQIVLNSPSIITPPELKSWVLCFPTGYSQDKKIHPAEVIQAAHQIANGRPVLCAGKAAHGMAEFETIEYMCAYIRDAQEVVTINTSTSILASALRKSWVHISDSPKHDFFHPNQNRIERKF